MKIFLMYYDRFATATTSKQLDVEHIVLCHNNSEKFNCIGDKGSLIQTDEPKGIQNNFNYGLALLKQGEWGIFMSDDLIGAKELKGNKFVNCSVSIVLNYLIKQIDIADKIGVKLVGLNSTGNPFYSKSKYSKFGLVDGRCFAIKKTGFRFHKDIKTIPDYYMTAYHLNKYGGNLILNHYYLDFKRYGEGGLGSISERAEDKMKDVKLMAQLFPNNIRFKDKPNEPKGSHIVITR